MRLRSWLGSVKVQLAELVGLLYRPDHEPTEAGLDPELALPLLDAC